MINAAEREGVEAELREYLRLIEEIRAMTGGKAGVSHAEKPAAQAKMKALKEKLKEDHQRLSHPQAALNPTEDAFLRPAVQAAKAHIREKWNSNPDGWHGDLAEAEVDVNYYLRAMTR